MKHLYTDVAREAKAMTRREVVQKAIDGKINWIQAAEICGVTARHMSRLRERYERLGIDGLRDGRTGKRQPRRISPAVEAEVCRLKEAFYQDWSVRHFHEFAAAEHGLQLGYTWTLLVLQKHGLAEKGKGRGQHRRRRERRPMCGMLLHLDASRHPWLADLPPQDLNVLLDDADGRILHALFVPEEGTHSTLVALDDVLRRYGRFAELYTDRGSHFCHTTVAGQGPDAEQNGHVTRALKALGIRHILARSPQARGRSERAFGTIQGRLPQELRLAGITDYAAANAYLTARFVPRFNQRFAVRPAQPESAFVPLVGLDLRLLLSSQHERRVRADNTVQFERLNLQLLATKQRAHYARCPVLVHELIDDTLAVSYQGTMIARFDRQANALPLRDQLRAAKADR
jgi:transposase